MPSFTQEQIEDWRRDRVSDSTIPSRKVPLDEWQINNMLKVCEADLREEESRLRCALLDVKTSRSNIRSLKKKRERILERKAEMEKVLNPVISCDLMFQVNVSMESLVSSSSGSSHRRTPG